MASILLVEDDKAIIENLKEFLATEGFDVKAVTGQPEAIRILEKEVFDLALLDISLAEGNGFAVCSYMKQNTDIPVIFLTGRGDMDSVKKVMALKPEGYLLKTLPEKDIKKMIDDFFAKKKNLSIYILHSYIFMRV